MTGSYVMNVGRGYMPDTQDLVLRLPEREAVIRDALKFFGMI